MRVEIDQEGIRRHARGAPARARDVLVSIAIVVLEAEEDAESVRCEGVSHPSNEARGEDPEVHGLLIDAPCFHFSSIRLEKS